MDNENYILITGWMVNELKLKGSELFVYALIYGFSQDGDSKFYGSRRYIADWFNCSLPTIDKALNGLLEKDLIIKDEEIINGVKFNRFKANKETLQDIKKLYRGGKETLLGGGKETLYNNNNINNNKDIYSYYEGIYGRTLNAIEYETMTKWLEDKTYEQIKEAIDETARSNIDNIKYVTKVLYSNKKKAKPIPSWFNENITTEEDSGDDEDFQNFIKEFRQ